jgi:predicted enzyme related to lactoylglutathione lyase
MSEVSLLVFPVKNLDEAKAFYTELLGIEPYTDAPYYVGFRVGNQEIGLDPHGHERGFKGAVPYWDFDDIRKAIQILLEAGGQIHEEIRDVGGGMLVASVKDNDGNIIGLRQFPSK